MAQWNEKWNCTQESAIYHGDVGHIGPDSEWPMRSSFSVHSDENEGRCDYISLLGNQHRVSHPVYPPLEQGGEKNIYVITNICVIYSQLQSHQWKLWPRVQERKRKRKKHLGLWLCSIYYIKFSSQPCELFHSSYLILLYWVLSMSFSPFCVPLHLHS